MLTEEEGVSFDEMDFHIAFGFNEMVTGQFIDAHPDSLRVLAFIVVIDFATPEHLTFFRTVKTHKCSQKDWEKFPAPTKTDKKLID